MKTIRKDSISKTAALITRKLLYNDCYYEGNISEKLFIKEEKIDMKFDVIVGNPPYNNDTTGKSGGARNDILWPKFVEKSLEHLKDNGHLCLVHPALWRKPEHKLWKVITNNQIEYLEIHSKPDGIKLFGVATRYDWYVLQKTSIKKLTNITDEDGVIYKIKLDDLDFIPNKKISEIKAILAKPGQEKCSVIYGTSYHGQRTLAKKNGKFKNPVIQTIDAHGLTIKYTNRKDAGHFDEAKVIVNDGYYTYPINDFDGKYGMSEHCFGITISSAGEGDNIVEALNTEKFKQILSASKFSNFGTDYRVFKYFRKDFWKEFV